MATTKAQRRLHARACKLLGVDPAKARLLGPSEFKAETGWPLGNSYGKADWEHNVIATKRKAGYDTYVHELLHLLFPSRPHWWVFSAGFKLSRLVHGRSAKDSALRRYGRTMAAGGCRQSRASLLRLARKSAARKGLASPCRPSLASPPASAIPVCRLASGRRSTRTALSQRIGPTSVHAGNGLLRYVETVTASSWSAAGLMAHANRC